MMKDALFLETILHTYIRTPFTLYKLIETTMKDALFLETIFLIFLGGSVVPKKKKKKKRTKQMGELIVRINITIIASKRTSESSIGSSRTQGKQKEANRIWKQKISFNAPPPRY